LKQIAPDSKKFLIWLFTGLRNDLANRMETEAQGSPDPGKAARDLEIFDALLTGLKQGAAPEDEAVRRYVAELALATDEENEFERVEREHRALAELGDALAPPQRVADSQRSSGRADPGFFPLNMQRRH
jgi:hypothetical protein